MLVFEHGQPALLYLVPGCCFSVMGTALYKGEFSLMWNFSEDEFITPPEEEEEEEEDEGVTTDAKDSKKKKVSEAKTTKAE